MTDIIPGAEPFFIPGGPVGALLLHGFTGSPKEMRPLADALATEGLTVLGPRLTHHGTQPADMLRSHWRDWLAAALDGYHLLRGHCRHIFILGLSMGGVLTLRLGARYPARGLVVMAAPSRPLHDKMDWRARFAGPLSYLFPYSPKGQPANPANALPDDHIAYPAYPVRAIPHLRQLLRDTAAALPAVTAPALVVHSRDDDSVPPENAQYIYDRLASADKALHWLDKGGHVITEGRERAALFAAVAAFVRERSPSESI